MWILYALGSASTAALVAIFAKIGLKNIDSTLATILRSVIMAVFLVGVGVVFKKFANGAAAAITTRDWIFIALSGLAGACSWLLYFLALKTGSATPVAALDRLSVVFVLIFSVLFLGDKFSWQLAGGVLLMALGAVLVVL